MTMTLELKRVTLYVQDIERQTVFYRDVLGLPMVNSPDDPSQFVEFEAGGCRIALHNNGVPTKAKRPPKLVFYAKDVGAARAVLLARGANMTKVVDTNVELHDGSMLQLCDGKDLEGNPFQLSNRD